MSPTPTEEQLAYLNSAPLGSTRVLVGAYIDENGNEITEYKESVDRMTECRYALSNAKSLHLSIQTPNDQRNYTSHGSRITTDPPLVAPEVKPQVDPPAKVSVKRLDDSHHQDHKPKAIKVVTKESTGEGGSKLPSGITHINRPNKVVAVKPDRVDPPANVLVKKLDNPHRQDPKPKVLKVVTKESAGEGGKNGQGLKPPPGITQFNRPNKVIAVKPDRVDPPTKVLIKRLDQDPKPKVIKKVVTKVSTGDGGSKRPPGTTHIGRPNKVIAVVADKDGKTPNETKAREKKGTHATGAATRERKR